MIRPRSFQPLLQAPAPVLQYADATTDSPVQLPAVFYSNLRGVIWIQLVCGSISVVLAPVLNWLWLLLGLLVIAGAALQWWSGRVPYLVVAQDRLEIGVHNARTIHRDDIVQIERCFNGLRVVRRSAEPVKISFIEMRRRDLPNVEPALRLMMSRGVTSM